MSVALDLGEGQAPGHAQRAATIGLRIATDLGFSADERDSILQTLLLKDAGCTGNASTIVQLLGQDDQQAKRLMRSASSQDWSSDSNPFLTRIRRIGRNAGPRLARELSQLRADAGARAAATAGCDESTGFSIVAIDERWDGSGFPHGLAGEEIPLAARIAGLSQAMDVAHAAPGLDAMFELVRSKRGEWFDPTMADVCTTWRHDRLWWHDLAYALQALPEAEHQASIDEAGLDRLADAFALIIDGKNPYARDHSRGVAAVAAGIGSLLGYDEAGLRGLRRAALLHDLGNLALSSRILDKAAPLSDDERETMREHPRFTWSVLRRVDAFEDIGWAAALHHERLDGSGYPWGLAENEQDLDARIIAIADAYQAVTEKRAYREGMSPDAAIRIIGKDSPHRYDARVFRALETWIAKTAA
jgi:HD-GYP domain-containing protein (c-di-GMP phosphodiesterase class II)